MRYRRRNDKFKIIFAIILFSFAGLVILFGRGRELFEETTAPLIAISANAGSSLDALTNETKSRAELIEKINELKNDNNKLRYQSLSERFLREENKQLKQQLDWKESEKDSFTLARIIAKPPATPFDTLTIQTDAIVNVKVGERVRVINSNEIGKISRVNKNTSIVTLYSSNGIRTPVEVNGTGALVIAEGVGGGTYTLHVPRSFKVKVGDVLTKPGADSVIIGVVESVEKVESDAFSLVRARLPINLFETTWVYVKNSSTE